MRDALFAISGLGLVGALYAVHRERALPVSAGGSGPAGVFSERFEPELRLKLLVRVAGFTFTGTGERSTEEPYEGRKIVTHRASAEGVVLGQKLSVDWSTSARYDAVTGFVMADTRVRLSVPGAKPVDVVAAAAREGDFLVVRIEGDPRPKVRPFPSQAQVSAGFMELAPVEFLEVGVRWNEQTIGLSGEVGLAEVEVVGRETFDLAGVRFPGFVAIVRTETATGRYKELRRWYDFGGRCLKQELSCGPATVVLERLFGPR